MQSKTGKKTNDNCNGFSLIELIIVIAIMGVFMVILAPQLLRHIEKARLQSDNSSINEVVNAMKLQAITGVPVTEGTYTGYIAVCSLVRYPEEDSFHIWLEPSDGMIDEFREYFINMHADDDILTAIDSVMLEICAKNSYEIAEIVSDIKLTSNSYKNLPWQTDHLGTFQEVLIISYYYNGESTVYIPNYISEVGVEPQVRIF